MSYIGREPQIGNFQICDAISVVNGQAAYTMQVGGANVSPETANHMIVSLNGIIQAPGTSYTVSGSTITFASNLATGDVINFIHILGSVLDLGVPSDGTVTAAKVANDLISGKTALATAPADTDEFLVSDAGTLKRIDYSLIKSSPGRVLIKEIDASDVAAVTFVHGTSDVVFDTTYDQYQLTWSNVKVVGDEQLRLQALSNGSALTSGYIYGAYGNVSGSATAESGTIQFMESYGDVESDHIFFGVANFYNVGVSSSKPSVYGQFHHKRSNGTLIDFGFSSVYNTAISDFNGITMTDLGGPNIASGKFKLYGIS